MRLYAAFAGYVLAMVVALGALLCMLWGALTLPAKHSWDTWQLVLYVVGLVQVLVAFVSLVLWVRTRCSRLARERKRWARIMGPEHE